MSNATNNNDTTNSSMNNCNTNGLTSSVENIVEEIEAIPDSSINTASSANGNSITDTASPYNTLNVDPYEAVAIDAMQQCLGYTPKHFQLKCISHIIRMKANCTQYPCKPTLLVQGTGGGKTSVYQCISMIKGGVTLVVQNTLALSSDQLSKVATISSRIPNTFAIQLDSVKGRDQREKVRKQLLEFPINSDVTIMLFSSPESLLIEYWSSVLDKLIRSSRIQFICFDEVHLFVTYGMSFRPSFIKLREHLFEKVKLENNNNNTNTSIDSVSIQSSILSLPILFMTASFNVTLQLFLEKMCGLSIRPDSTIWADARSFEKRNINIDITLSKQRMKIIKETLCEELKTNLSSKAIVYTSIATSSISIQDEIDSFLDKSPEIVGDTVLINGEMEPEWKYVSAQRFTEQNDHVEDLVSNNQFNARILVATSGCIGAGLDSSDVHVVIRDGIPSSILDLIQEMGRCGRGVNSSTGQNNAGHFHIVINSKTIEYLIIRIFEEDDSLSEEETLLLDTICSKKEREMFELNSLLLVMRLVFLYSAGNKKWTSVIFGEYILFSIISIEHYTKHDFQAAQI